MCNFTSHSFTVVHSLEESATYGEDDPFDMLIYMKSYGPLDNYIEMYRNQAGLSQEDLSYLISVERGASVSRYEQGLRFPNLETLLALEVVFGAQVSDIYAGIADRVRQNVERHAKELLEEMPENVSKDMILKIETLSRLAHSDDSSIVPIWEDE